MSNAATVINGYTSYLEKTTLFDCAKRIEGIAKTILNSIQQLSSNLQNKQGNWEQRDIQDVIDGANSLKGNADQLVSLVNEGMKGVAKSHVFMYLLAYAFKDTREEVMGLMASIKQWTINYPTLAPSGEAEILKHLNIINLSVHYLLFSLDSLFSVDSILYFQPNSSNNNNSGSNNPNTVNNINSVSYTNNLNESLNFANTLQTYTNNFVYIHNLNNYLNHIINCNEFQSANDVQNYIISNYNLMHNQHTFVNNSGSNASSDSSFWEELLKKASLEMKKVIERIITTVNEKKKRLFIISSLNMMRLSYLICHFLMVLNFFSPEILSRKLTEIHHCSVVITSNGARMVWSDAAKGGVKKAMPSVENLDSITAAKNSVYNLLNEFVTEVDNLIQLKKNVPKSRANEAIPPPPSYSAPPPPIQKVISNSNLNNSVATVNNNNNTVAVGGTTTTASLPQPQPVVSQTGNTTQVSGGTAEKKLFGLVAAKPLPKPPPVAVGEKQMFEVVQRAPPSTQVLAISKTSTHNSQVIQENVSPADTMMEMKGDELLKEFSNTFPGWFDSFWEKESDSKKAEIIEFINQSMLNN